MDLLRIRIYFKINVFRVESRKNYACIRILNYGEAYSFPHCKFTE